MIRSILEKILVYFAVNAIKKHKSFIIAITGSVGKTTTREAIYAVLSSKYEVKRNLKNYNNLLGVSMTILGLPVPYDIAGKVSFIKAFVYFVLGFHKMPSHFVLEYGADKPDDIDKLASNFRPDVAIVTAIGDTPVHVANYPSIDAVAHEKANIIRHLKSDGLAILNKDDKRVLAMSVLTDATKYFYGRDQILDSKFLTDDGSRLGRHAIVRHGGLNLEFNMYNIISEHQVMDLIPAVVIGDMLGIGREEIKLSLESYRFPSGRMALLEGIKNSILIDDTYNASPLSTAEALKTFAEIKKVMVDRRDLAYLGEMKELGEYGPEEHYKIGQLAGEICDELIAVGDDNAIHFIRGFKSTAPDKKSSIFQKSSEASEYAIRNIREGDLVLIKGSQSVRMEFIVKALLQDKATASRVLVRQTSDWL